MRIIRCNSKEEIANTTYDTFIEYLEGVKDPVIGFATGSSPSGFYNTLIKNHKQGNISFKAYKSFNLDEYVGLERTHPQSYSYFMRQALFDHIDINKENIFNVNGGARDIEKECQNYESLLDEFRIDIQILGIGSNGHIAFNEPKTPLNKGVHLVRLNERTIADNARFFDSINDVPRTAITMGPKNILHAKKIILIAQGKGKAEAVREMLYGDVTDEVPASILQLHRHVTVIADVESTSLIND